MRDMFYSQEYEIPREDPTGDYHFETGYECARET